ncbi:chromobox protein homolog 1 [Diaphorina citri]|uniref:Chromobox protein homolog 1 n=1 Tax=Diaphorina citri TaxID=121845 RepID=A0A1S4EG74_DIACI|nr:chromobox protein homolog 1 [Diaphorina citri]
MSDNESGSGNEEEYTVEKILDRRVVKGKVEYYIKWEGYGNDENTWEPEENLTCPDMIKEFEENRKNKEAKKKEKEKVTTKKSLSSVESSEENSKDSTSKKRKESNDSSGKGINLYFIIMWRYTSGDIEVETYLSTTETDCKVILNKIWRVDEADLVPAKEANLKCPQIVIKFYEERLTWNSSGRNSN